MFEHMYFSFGGYFTGHWSLQIDKEGDGFLVSFESFSPSNPSGIGHKTMTLDQDEMASFTEEVSALGVEDWFRYWIDPGVLDGSSWYLRFDDMEYRGQNDYPEQYGDFLKLLRKWFGIVDLADGIANVRPAHFHPGYHLVEYAPVFDEEGFSTEQHHQVVKAFLYDLRKVVDLRPQLKDYHEVLQAKGAALMDLEHVTQEQIDTVTSADALVACLVAMARADELDFTDHQVERSIESGLVSGILGRLDKLAWE